MFEASGESSSDVTTASMFDEPEDDNATSSNTTTSTVVTTTTVTEGMTTQDMMDIFSGDSSEATDTNTTGSKCQGPAIGLFCWFSELVKF